MNKMEPQTVKPALKVKNLRVADEVVVAEAQRRVVLQEALEDIPQLDADLAVVPFADQLPYYRGLISSRHLTAPHLQTADAQGPVVALAPVHQLPLVAVAGLLRQGEGQLRREVEGTPVEVGAGEDVVLVIHLLRRTEVQQLGVPQAVEPDVLRPEVEVREPELVEAVERHGELGHVEEGEFLGEDAVVPVARDSIGNNLG